MTQYVYMNHRIREKKPKGPVIVVQDDFRPDGANVMEANEFDIWFHGEKIGRVVYNPKGLAVCDTHEVKAWVEFDDLVIVADPKKYAKPEKPVASEKKPNRKVRT